MKNLEDCKHPDQPIGLDSYGFVRFKANAIVRWLIDEAGRGRVRNLNDIAAHEPEFSVEDKTQFWQLLGYSVSGIGDMDFIDRERLAGWDAIAERGLAERRSK
jgi:hypothetical protein